MVAELLIRGIKLVLITKSTPMKAFALILFLFSLLSCHKNLVESQEVKATLTGYQVSPDACSTGYLIKVESGQEYLAHQAALPAPYNDYANIKLPASVWIRYMPASKCNNVSSLITILSIRVR